MNINDIYQPDEYGDPVDTLTAAIRANPTEAGIKHLVEAQRAINELAEGLFWDLYRADPEWRGHFIDRPGIRGIEFGGDTVEIECSCRACNRGCCGTDYHTYRIPLADLWRDRQAVLNGVAAAIKERERLAEEQQRQEEAEEKRQWEAAERAQLKALAEKYPEELKP